MKLSLRISALFIAALSVIFMGCLHGDDNSSLTNRLTAAEAELSTTQTELSTVRGELSTVRGDLTDAQDALTECQDTGLGILEIEWVKCSNPRYGIGHAKRYSVRCCKRKDILDTLEPR